MSDTGRRGFSSNDRGQSTPDTAKITQEKLDESTNNNTNRAGRGDLNDNVESTSQGVHDKSQRSSDRESSPTLY
ncbi:MAG: hypothetical protein M1830_009065 [Pleopsidium flavum]|nr:MAG: hypothetical protein M1830_009065 [Pleopsidium flavum]